MDRDPRQIKFLLPNDDFYNAWDPRALDRRQIKFRSLADSPGYDNDLGGLERRQIKFHSLPDTLAAESAIPGDPPTQYDGARRQQRQIKFRSLAERAVEAKKHAESQQVKIDAVNNVDHEPLMTFPADVNHQFQLPTYWYRRR